MIKLCQVCGAEYEAHASYCNVCKRETLMLVETASPPRVRPSRLMADAPTLGFVSLLWLLGLGYLLAEVRPRSWGALGLSWAALALVTTAFCFAMRNPRIAAFFSAFGLVFCAIYGFLQM